MNGELVGGLYGVSIGRMFYGESMFSRKTDASKIALAHLAAQLKRWNFGMIDCQMNTAHLASLGAREIPRREFLIRLRELIHYPDISSPWFLDDDLFA
jgi:leucyl/phenylalanyl-tRNA--protein transferase